MAEQHEATVTDWGRILSEVPEAIGGGNIESIARLDIAVTGCSERLSSIMKHFYLDATTNPDHKEQELSLGDYRTLLHGVFIDMSTASYDLKKTTGDALSDIAVGSCICGVLPKDHM